MLNVLDPQNNVHKGAQLHRHIEDFFRRKLFDFLKVNGLFGLCFLEIAVDGENTGPGTFGGEQERPVERCIVPPLVLATVLLEEKEGRTVFRNFLRPVCTTIIRSIHEFSVCTKSTCITVCTLEAPDLAISIIRKVVDNRAHLIRVPHAVQICQLLAIAECLLNEVDNLIGRLHIHQEIVIHLKSRIFGNELVNLGNRAVNLAICPGLETDR